MPRDETIDIEVVRAMPAKGTAERTTPLVFLHGAFAGAWCWTETFLPYFADNGYRCYALSFRGHGDSGGRDGIHELGIADYVSDVRNLLDELDQAPVLIGHSMGGFVAMKVAETFGASGLVLIASVPPSGLVGPSLSLAIFNPLLLFEIGMVQGNRPRAMSVTGLRQALFSDHVPQQTINHYLPLMGPESQRAIAELHGIVCANPNTIKGRMPVLVMGAVDDGLIPQAYIRAKARSFEEHAMIFDNMGHGMMLDAGWKRVAAHLARWLAGNDI